ncbi:hypothetical protein ES708_19800 [subsurface metagenome]
MRVPFYRLVPKEVPPPQAPGIAIRLEQCHYLIPKLPQGFFRLIFRSLGLWYGKSPVAHSANLLSHTRSCRTKVWLLPFPGYLFRLYRSIPPGKSPGVSGEHSLTLHPIPIADLAPLATTIKHLCKPMPVLTAPGYYPRRTDLF